MGDALDAPGDVHWRDGPCDRPEHHHFNPSYRYRCFLSDDGQRHQLGANFARCGTFHAADDDSNWHPSNRWRDRYFVNQRLAPPLSSVERGAD